MRSSKVFALTLACLTGFLYIGCEGPTGDVGPQGPAGEDGEDAQVTCLECHSDATFNDNLAEMNRSQHGLGEFVGYAGGREGCAQCHGGNGFVEWATSGTVPGDIIVPTAWECNTCHSLHETFDETFGEDMDYALRVTDPVLAMFDGTTMMDVDPSSNLCLNCHQARRDITSYDDGTGEAVLVTSSHVGPHHGPQGNMLLGNNGVEPGSPFNPHLGAGCVGCHMYETTSAEEMNVAGGHTFWPAVEACNECHPTEDFNYHDVQDDIEELLEELGDLLVGEGILAWEVDAEGDSSRHLVDGVEYDREVFQAFWNWIYVEEDRSLGVHNPPYAEDLLEEAIDLVTSR